jgi:TonB family protein
MEMSMRGRNRRRRTGGSANEQWKSQWKSVRRWSAFAAVMAHAAVFAWWPVHEVPTLPSSAGFLPAELIALPDHRPLPEPLEWVATTAERNDVPAVEEQRVDQLEEFMATMKRPRASLAASAAATLRPHPEVEPLARLSFAPQGAVLTDYGPQRASFTWPEIRNPRAMVRFLRAQYNVIHTHVVPDRFVSLALWINELGMVEWCEVRESSGDPSLDQIALAAINDVVEFIPASRHGAPVSVAVVLSIPFQVPW